MNSKQLEDKLGFLYVKLDAWKKRWAEADGMIMLIQSQIVQLEKEHFQVTLTEHLNQPV